MKRIYATLVLLLMLISVNAQTTFSLDGIKYITKTVSTVEVTSGGTYTNSITIPSTVLSSGVTYNVTAIGNSAFYNCSSLTSINIPLSVTSIGSSAFFGCTGLTSIAIPSSVDSIGYHAFYRCVSMTSINIADSNIKYSSLDGVLFNKNNNVLISCPEGKIGSYSIPSSVDSIGDDAFLNCKGLTSINIPKSVISIGDYAFRECKGLTSINIPSSVTSIGEQAFSYCTGLTSVFIPTSVTSFGNYAFNTCSSLTSINIPTSITSISEGLLMGCENLTSISIPSSVTSIGYAALVCTGLTSIAIPSSVTLIGDDAFNGCTHLTFISIPNSVTSIGKGVFSGCTGLKSITSFAMTPPTIFAPTTTSEDAFYNVNKGISLYVPLSSIDQYKNATSWDSFTNYIGMSSVGNIITTDSVYVTAGTEFNVPIKTTAIPLSESIISYQFKMNYDTTKIEFVGYSKDSTLSENGTIIVNQSQNGNMQIGCISSNSISGLGTLLNLQFKAINSGEVTPSISDFLLNTDTITHISNGTISILTRYGDVDDNDKVQAYDAALVLQNSVGLDPIPSIDPIPWSSWRIEAADVDNNGSITANDAGLILQKSIGMISSFPTEETTLKMLRSATLNSKPDVTITLENNNLVFKSFGNLIGLNVKISGAKSSLDKPQILNDDMISAFNCNEDSFSVGLATAITPEEGSTIMKIPVNSPTYAELRFDIIINTTEKVVSLNVPAGTISIDEKEIGIYTNSDRMIHVSNALGKSISIFDASGRKILEKQTLQDSEAIQVKTPGLYLVRVDNVTKKVMVN